MMSFFSLLSFIVYSAFGDNKLSKELHKNKQLYASKPSLQFPDINLLENGDIIFRRGYGVDSTVAANFSEGEKRYSHAGIIYKKEDKIYVIHSEDDDEGHNGVFMENLDDFIDNSPIWAVYRYKVLDKIKVKMIQESLAFLHKHTKFDNDFDLKDDDKMYCTEFIYKVVNRSAKKEIIHAGKRFMSRTFVTISDLYENSYAFLLQSNYKKIKE